MSAYRIEVAVRPEFADPVGAAVLSDVRDLGVAGVEEVRVVDVYLVWGDISQDQAGRIAGELLADPVNQYCAVDEPLPPPREGALRSAQVFRKPGVMDPVAASAAKGIRDLIAVAPEGVRTGKKYLLYGALSEQDLGLVAGRVLHNAAIEMVYPGEAEVPHAPEPPRYRFKRVEVNLAGASDHDLLRISRERTLSLNLEEMTAIRDHFARLGHSPTDVELETLAQTWSEHCNHKTFRGIIEFEGEVIDNLLKSTVFRVTAELNRPWCLSVFRDNAWVIEFDDETALAFKVETHNHPSAIEPYGGAGTGIGGVIRDIMGVGLGARPVMNTDVFCFGPPDMPRDQVPPGALHPKRVMKGVVSGVRDYGNRMGIPTANGAVLFDERYVGNPLVYCGTAGIMPRSMVNKEAHPGDVILTVGGRTGRDGIHGATFSSVELHEESDVVDGGAVQIGNAIEEKRTLDCIMVARDRGLYSCITDCGAGGLSSAVGEMGEDIGAEVDLETAPLKYEGLGYVEIWISEAQERMVLAVPPESLDEILAVFAAEDVEATPIGRFTGDRRLRLRYRGVEVCDLDMAFLHNGVPRRRLKATWTRPSRREPDLPDRSDYGDALKRILGSWNVCSKEWVIRQYDHEVQGAGALKPLVGVADDGPGDAAVIAPRLGSTRGLIISNGINPRYGDIDPYAMAASAIDEAVRQVIAVGGDLERTALLDNFCWGNTDKPDRLGSFVLASRACYDVARVYGTPFISGKDSLNNEFRVGDEFIVIPPTLLISAISVMPDVTRCVSMDAKAPGGVIYVVGLTLREMGAGSYYAIHGEIGDSVPQVRPQEAKKLFDALSAATAARLVRSLHDCSEGGIAVAAAEMAFAGGLGMDLYLTNVPTEGDIREHEVLFSESNSRFIAEVSSENCDAFEAALDGLPARPIGRVVRDPRFTVRGREGETLINEPIADLKEAWQAPLRW